MEINELQAVADLTCEALRIPPVAVAQITKRRGYARNGSRSVSIPKWATERSEAYAIYYVVHEVCHHIAGMGHGTDFQDCEVKALALWDIKIERKKIYARALYSGNGEKLCGDRGTPPYDLLFADLAKKRQARLDKSLAT